MSSIVTTRSIADLPAPRGLPLLGNALQLKPQTMHLQLEAWARELGPMYRIRVGSKRAAVITDMELAQQAMRDRPETFRRLRAFEPVAKELGMHFLFTAEGEMWKRQRRLWMASLNAQQLKPFHEGLAAVTRRLLRRWQRAADRGESLDVLAELMRYTVDVTMLFAMGVDANTLEQGEDVIQRHLGEIFRALGRRLFVPFPYWHYIRLPADRRVERALVAVRTEVQRLIEVAKARMDADPARRAAPSCLLEALLVAREQDGEGFSDDDVYANTIGALLAGEDTTANTLCWMVHYLSLHADIFSGARGEADALLGTYTGEDASAVAGVERFPAYLPYVDGTMNEVLRLRPIGPFFFLSTQRDTVLGDLALPAGSDVILLTRQAAGCAPEASPAPQFAPAAHDTPANAAPARDTVPERSGVWLPGSDIESLPGEAKRGAGAGRSGASRTRLQTQGTVSAPGRAPTMPFGYGPRLCPGRNLAIAEMRSVALMLARNFELESVPGPGPVQERALFTIGPANVRVRLRRRAAA